MTGASGVTDVAPVPAAPRPARQPQRRDIQGLRCVAVVVVVLYHAGVTGLAGGFVGVDVFFVISGFLITGNIVRHLDDGSFGLFRFWANRARRLLPAAFVAIAATIVLTYVLLPPTRFASVAKDGIASAVYAMNWRLAQQSVDYLATDRTVSPFQHFWSLGVEEQFYLVWPLLLLAVSVLVARTVPRRRTAAFALALTVVFVPSLVASVILTSTDPGPAYFVTPTRMWELALGGGLALAAPHLARAPHWAGVVAGWSGLAAIAYAVVGFDAATPVPGWIMLVPTVGAAGVIAAGAVAPRWGPAAVLSWGLPVAIGDISYSLYLWHFPLIVVATTTVWRPAPPVWIGLLAGAAAVVPAWLSWRFVEQPVRRSPRVRSTGRGLALGAVATAASVAAAVVLVAVTPTARAGPLKVTADGRLVVRATGAAAVAGAEVLPADPQGADAGAPRARSGPITPNPLKADRDIPLTGGCLARLGGPDTSCTFGAPGSDVVVDLVGDSHAMQWLPALQAAAVAGGWKLVTRTRAACPVAPGVVLAHHDQPTPECDACSERVIDQVVADRPQLVLVSASPYQVVDGGRVASVAASRPALTEAYERAFTRLAAGGAVVAPVLDTPRFDYDVVGCVARNPDQLDTCTRPRSDAHDPDDAFGGAARTLDAIDLNAAICPTAVCAAVIGDVLVYRDDNHLTATYSASLAARMQAQVAARLPSSRS